MGTDPTLLTNRLNPEISDESPLLDPAPRAVTLSQPGVLVKMTKSSCARLADEQRAHVSRANHVLPGAASNLPLHRLGLRV